ncbi:MAG: ATP synthase F1 subunit epsilon, partial [Pseudomonadota bacterium]
TLKFDLITPEKTFFSEQASQIDIPGSEGEFGVLAGHAALISSLKAGVVKIYSGKGDIKKLFVTGGIAEVNATSCSVLAEKVIDLDKITKSDAEKNLATARNKLENSFDDNAKRNAKLEVETAEAVIGFLQ